MKMLSEVSNSFDLDETLSFLASDWDLSCLHMDIVMSGRLRVKYTFKAF